MGSVLIINAAGRETRVALVENGSIAEFYLERKKDKGIVGNVYKGRVTRVLPGMQAAFVDIGQEKAAFLYVGDVLFDPDVAKHQFDLTEGEHDDDLPEGAELGEEQAPGDSLSDVVDLTARVGGTESGEAPMPALVEGAPAASAEPAGGGAAEPEAGTAVAVLPAPSLPFPAGSLPEPRGAGEAPADLPPSPSGAEVVAAALAQSHDAGVVVPREVRATPSASGADSGPAAEAPAPIPEQSLEAPRSQAPRDLRLREESEREPRHRDRERNRDRDRDRDRDREKRRSEGAPRKLAKIEDLLKVGQEVLVQVSKDPIGTKGARLTAHISIPGRHLVFMPTVDHVGTSRRISNEKERRRLRETVDRLRPPGTGFIVRTVAENVPQDKLEADIRFLIDTWNETVRKSEKNHRPGLMHPDLDLILRATRDLFAHDVEQLVIDDRDEYERVLSFVAAHDPSLKDRIVLHEGEEPVFDAYGIEEEIKRATARKVWLKSGGYLIIDQAEALTAVDVNSGRYVGKKNLEDTITKINVEASKEIVYQLRLRNIGGIIICDFIDMEKQQNRDKVFKALQEALGRDKAKTNVLRISELGLVEMTRKRVRESIGRVLHEDCAYCGGQGYVKTATTVAYEIFRELRRSGPSYKDPTIVVQCQTEVANTLQGAERDELRHLMDRFNKSIQVRGRADYHREQYDLYARPVSGLEFKVGGSVGEFEPVTHGLARRPGSGEARYSGERGAGERGGGERAGGERGDRSDRGERGRKNKGNFRAGGGGGGGGGNQQGRPSRPQNSAAASPGGSEVSGCAPGGRGEDQ